GIRRRVDEAEAEERRGAAARDDVGGLRNDLAAKLMRRSFARADAVRLDQRSAERRKRVEDVAGARAESRDHARTRSADRRRAVTFDARASVEDGTEAVLRAFDVEKLAAAGEEIGELRRRQAGQRVAGIRLRRTDRADPLPLHGLNERQDKKEKQRALS